MVRSGEGIGVKGEKDGKEDVNGGALGLKDERDITVEWLGPWDEK